MLRFFLTNENDATLKIARMRNERARLLNNHWIMVNAHQPGLADRLLRLKVRTQKEVQYESVNTVAANERT